MRIGRVGAFTMVRCTECSTWFADQLPPAGEEENYDAYYTDANLAVPPFIRSRIAELIQSFEPFRATNRFLDVGFGSGVVLDGARSLRWEAFGTEVAAVAVASAQAKGFRVTQGDLHQASYPSAFFDVVVLTEVIEHVPSPGDLIAEVRRVLRPGGLLWCTTPNIAGLSGRLLGLRWTVVSPPEHLQLFTPLGLTTLLRRSGFSKVDVATEGLNPFELLHAWRTDASQSTPGTPFNRVGTAQDLNAKLTTSRKGRVVKATANALLRLVRLGDSLKCRAV